VYAEREDELDQIVIPNLGSQPSTPQKSESLSAAACLEDIDVDFFVQPGEREKGKEKEKEKEKEKAEKAEKASDATPSSALLLLPPLPRPASWPGKLTRLPSSLSLHLLAHDASAGHVGDDRDGAKGAAARNGGSSSGSGSSGGSSSSSSSSSGSSGSSSNSREAKRRRLAAVLGDAPPSPEKRPTETQDSAQPPPLFPTYLAITPRIKSGAVQERVLAGRFESLSRLAVVCDSALVTKKREQVCAE
jgi:hypothetical protein